MVTLTKKDFAGTINVKNEMDPTDLYVHQVEAMQAMDKKVLASDKDRFAGLLVLPTGGGKTLTAVQWVLKNVINKNKKVLWVAHRSTLLEQALSAVEQNAYSSLISQRRTFNYRIISGEHDRTVNIRKDDDFIIASKDSLNMGIEHLVNNWLKYNDQIFLVIDEAHRAVTKSYRKIMDVINQKTKSSKILGLTATPFRTAEVEKGLLKKIFTDDIIYKVDLSTLITRGILSEPITKEIRTNMDLEGLSEVELKMLEDQKDNPSNIPAKFITQIVSNKVRNNRIVQAYVEHKAEFGKTLVFAENKIHAIALNRLFFEKGIRSAYVFSEDPKMKTDKDLSPRANKEKLQRFRRGELDVLINVGMYTEGTDIPDVQTVFITRQTTSQILMTQMIGRALRGPQSGGTEKAYIVSFVDNWKNKIAWMNPWKLFREDGEWIDSVSNHTKDIATFVSIERIEEFIKVSDDSIDPSELERIDFAKIIPVGTFLFPLQAIFEDGEETKENYEIIVYDNTLPTMQKFIRDLPSIFSDEGLSHEELLDKENLKEWTEFIFNGYFNGLEMIPNHTRLDIRCLLLHFAFTGEQPILLKFKDRDKYNVANVAHHIYDHELGGKRRKQYIDSLWDENGSFFKVFFNNNKFYFRKCIDIELMRLEEPELFSAIPA